MTARSYWQSCVADTESAREALKSWFPWGICDGMTPYKAEILCDLETDAEKKLRAFMVDDRGQHIVFTRSRGKRETVISIKPIKPNRIGPSRCASKAF
jgi:hypothetical protein